MATTTRVTGPSQNIADLNKTTSKSTASTDKSTLGKDQFLQLLVTQLKYQDPLNPVDDKEFIGQMAQFSSLEQMQNLNTSFATSKALGMVGKYAIGQVTEEDGTVKEIKGNVDSIKMKDNKVYALIGGREVSVDDISEFKEKVDDATALDINKVLSLVGKSVVGNKVDSDGKKTEVSGTVQSVKLIDNKTYAVVNGEQILVDDITSINEDAFNNNYISKYTDIVGKYVSSVVSGIEDNQLYKVQGTVSAVNILSASPVAILNNVSATIDSLELSDEEKASYTTMSNYLNSNIGNSITAVVVDQNGNKTKLVGKLRSFEGETNPTAIFDDVGVTLDSIYEVSDGE